MYINTAYRYLNFITLYPFIDSFSHHAATRELTRKLTAPNSTLNLTVLLVEDDFTTIFPDKAARFDIIVTRFFIDTMQNLQS
jgi:hypothetical protein